MSSIDSLEEDHGVERRPAQRAARRPLLPPRAHGLDDAPPAAAGVAARPQLAVGRARQAHRARVPIVIVARAAADTDGGVAAFSKSLFPRLYPDGKNRRVLTFLGFPCLRISWIGTLLFGIGLCET